MARRKRVDAPAYQAVKPDPDVLTVADIAARLQVSDSYVRLLIERGELPRVKRFGRLVRVHRADYEAYAAQLSQRGIEVA